MSHVRLGLVIAFVALPGAHAAAQAPPSKKDLPVYVSDQFRKAARKVAQEIVVAQLAEACPKDQPLCRVVVERLGEAVAASISKDPDRVRTALSGFFVDSSTHAFLHAIVRDVVSPGEVGQLAEITRPLAECIAAGLTQKRGTPGCQVDPKTVSRLLTQLGVIRCAAGAKSDDCRAIESTLEDLTAHRPLQPARSIRVLAAIASSDRVQRQDVRIYLLNLQRFLDRGLEGGLFGAAYSFLTEEPPATVVEDLVAHDPVDPKYQLWRKDEDAAFERALTGCNQDLARFEAWKRARDDASAPFIETARLALLRGESFDVSPVTALLAYTCAEASSDATKLEQLRSQARHLATPIRVHSALHRYGVAGLAAAAILDYARTNDDAQLEADVRATLTFAAEELALAARTSLDLRAEAMDRNKRIQKLRTHADARSICEVQDFMQLAFRQGGATPAAAGAGTCFSLAENKDRPVAPLVLPAALGVPDGRIRAEALAARLDPIRKLIAGMSRSTVFTEARAAGLLRAARYFAEGNAAAARTTVARLGVDLLVEQVDLRTAEFFATTDAHCDDEVRTTSIFSGLGAACAAQVLIKSAYYPMADVLWEAGVGSMSSAEVASRAYRSLQDSDHLDFAPLILNVGLGGNYITGFSSSSIWSGGYGAFTILDKYGVAFWRRRTPRSRYEFGLFAGGFLDALVRTIADSGEEERFWLLGLTAGAPRWRGLDLGLEVHAAVAMPFQLDQSGRYGLALGAAVVVPFDLLFDGEN